MRSLILLRSEHLTRGHVNVDDFRFSWHPSFYSRSTTPSSDGSSRRFPAGGVMMYSGEPRAGAVYAFRRRNGETLKFFSLSNNFSQRRRMSLVVLIASLEFVDISLHHQNVG